MMNFPERETYMMTPVLHMSSALQKKQLDERNDFCVSTHINLV